MVELYGVHRIVGVDVVTRLNEKRLRDSKIALIGEKIAQAARRTPAPRREQPRAPEA